MCSVSVLQQRSGQKLIGSPMRLVKVAQRSLWKPVQNSGNSQRSCLSQSEDQRERWLRSE